MQLELVKELSELCRGGGYDPVALANIGADVDLLMPVLEQSILLRESGAAELSLALLDKAEAGGLMSGWIEDNRARAFLLLQRRDEAKKLWLELKLQPEETLRKVADEQLKQLEVEERIPELWSQLQWMAEDKGWTYSCLSSKLISYSKFEQAVLEEAIIAREKGSDQFALSMLDMVLKAGFRSPWLRDNQARSLLNTKNVIEACRIWRELEAGCDLSDLRSAATTMLHHCRREERRALAVQREQMRVDSAKELHQKGDLVSAVEELIKGWIDFPVSEHIEEFLLELIELRRIKEDPLWSELSPWLKRYELSLEAHEALLGVFEKKLDI